MVVRTARSGPADDLQGAASSRKHAALILSVPAISLLLPGLAVVVATAGGSGEFTRICAAVSKFLLFYSGVFALIGLSGAVAAGLLATDRIVMTPETRILSQAMHRTMSLFGISALGNHVLLEVMANRAGIADGFIPFLAHRNTFFMGLGTIASDLFVMVIATGLLRRRFTQGKGTTRWRMLHSASYAAWLLSILHGLLAGRSAKPYVDWSYGACLAFAGLALLIRQVMEHRGRNSATGQHAPAPPGRSALPVPAMAGAEMTGLPQLAASEQARAITAGPYPAGPPPVIGPMRAITAGPPPISGPLPRIPRADTGPVPRVPRGGTGPIPRVPRGDTGPVPRVPRGDTGPVPRVPRGDSAAHRRPPAGYPRDPRDSGAWPADPRDSGAWQADPRGGYDDDPRAGYPAPRGGREDSRGYAVPRGGYGDPRGGYGDPRGGYDDDPRAGYASPGYAGQGGWDHPRGGYAEQGGWDDDPGYGDPRGGYEDPRDAGPRRPAPRHYREWR